jgi:hypothetical protein
LKLRTIALFVSLALCTSAFANNNGNGKGSGQDNSPGNGVTNSGQDNGKGNGGVDNGNKGGGNPTDTGNGGNGGQGGNGGNGGQGGNGGSSKSDSTSVSSSSSSAVGIGVGGSAKATGGSVKNSGNSSNTNVNVAEGGKGGSAKQGQSQSSTSSASTGDQKNAQSTSVSSTYNQVRQAPAVIAPDAYPSAPCRVSGSIGASAPIGGISLGGSKLDDQCDKRETARSFALINNREAAARILCSTKAAKEAGLTLADCLASTPAAPAATVPAVASAPTAALTAAPTPVEPVVLVPYVERHVENATFHGKRVDNVTAAKLDTAALYLKNVPTSVITIDGTQKHVDAVREYLDKSGVDEARMVINVTDDKAASSFSYWTE